MTRLILIVNDVPAPGDAWPQASLECGHSLDLLICAPHLPLHVSRWLTPLQRAHWRQDWAADLVARWRPLCRPAEVARATLAQGPLHAALARLQADGGEPSTPSEPTAARLPARVLDLRRRRVGAELQPLHAGSPQPGSRWVAPLVASSSLSALLFLAD